MCRGAAGGGQAIGHGLIGDTYVENKVGLLGKIRLGVAYHGHNAVASQLDEWHQHLDLGCLAALREHDHDIALADNTQVAMDGVGGMHEDSRRACRVQRRHNLLGDDGALTNTRENKIPLVLQQQLHRILEIIIDLTLQP